MCRNKDAAVSNRRVRGQYGLVLAFYVDGPDMAKSSVVRKSDADFSAAKGAYGPGFQYHGDSFWSLECRGKSRKHISRKVEED
ncbi:hypothetical protein NQZ68_007225 [Dissostichus eleginoides]|nr:hypothetical protein NQZ68_007225 [Dissostichus eleginoides]